VPHAAAGWSFPHRATYPTSHRSPPRRPLSCRNQSSTALPVEPSPGRLASIVSRRPSHSVTPCCGHPRVSRRSIPSSEPASPSPCVDPNRSSSPSSSHIAGEALPSSLSQPWRSTVPGARPWRRHCPVKKCTAKRRTKLFSYLYLSI
jgi:hypothetical protein